MSFMLLSVAKNLASAERAATKVEALVAILNRYFPDWEEYDGKSDINNVQTALKYCVSKKGTKAKRKAAQGAAGLVFGTTGLIVGGAAGSFVLPGAGTVAGAVTVGEVLAQVPTVGFQGYRRFKGLYKLIKGTRGVHRQQCAMTLVGSFRDPPVNNSERAAGLALAVILGEEEFTMVMGDPEEDAKIARVADRLKSW